MVVSFLALGAYSLHLYHIPTACKSQSTILKVRFNRTARKSPLNPILPLKPPHRRLLQPPLELEERVLLVPNGGHDEALDSQIVPRQRVGQKLIPQHDGGLAGAAQVVHGFHEVLLEGFSALGVGGNAEGAVEQLHPLPIIVGDEGDANARLGEGGDPALDALVGLGLLVGG